MVTTVSRGIETIWICLVEGVTRHNCTTSLRWPVTTDEEPKDWTADPVSPTRVSEPMTRIVKGPPPWTATSSATWILLIWL